MQQSSQSYLERARQNQDHESPTRMISDGIERALERKETTTEEWQKFESHVESLGLTKKDPISYLASAIIHHGSEILVRRGSLHRLFDSLNSKTPLTITALDDEPNAALLGNSKGDVNGIEVALEGGFGWFVENKVAGVFGFIPHDTLFHQDSVKSEVTSSKKGSHLMKRVEGKVHPDDVLFVLLRIHKTAYPEELLTEDDFDDLTGEVKPFILRLYAKNHQTH